MALILTHPTPTPRQGLSSGSFFFSWGLGWEAARVEYRLGGWIWSNRLALEKWLLLRARGFSRVDSFLLLLPCGKEGLQTSRGGGWGLRDEVSELMGWLSPIGCSQLEGHLQKALHVQGFAPLNVKGEVCNPDLPYHHLSLSVPSWMLLTPIFC